MTYGQSGISDREEAMKKAAMGGRCPTYRVVVADVSTPHEIWKGVLLSRRNTRMTGDWEARPWVNGGAGMARDSRDGCHATVLPRKPSDDAIHRRSLLLGRLRIIALHVEVAAEKLRDGRGAAAPLA